MPSLSIGQTIFWVLVVGVAIILLIRAFVSKKKTEAEPTVMQVSQEPVQQTSPSAAANAATDAEIIAVISAAVAAMSGIKSTYNLQIRSIKRQGQSVPIWNSVSRKENLESRF